MSTLGYPPPVVREMYLHECASMLGSDGRPPVIVGSRWLELPKDDSRGGGAAAPSITPEREAEAKRRFDERARAQAAAAANREDPS